MASQFQNRLVGAVVVVALGVIILPSILDGDKKHYQQQFAAIPLVPRTEVEQLMGSLPPVTEALAEVIARPSVTESPPVIAIEPPPVQGGVVEAVRPPVQVPVETPAVNDFPLTKSAETAPKGQAYVIQLGALSNVEQVNSIRAQLQLNGYRVYTLPATPVAGKVTRIFIGPEINKSKLDAELANLKELTNLEGVVRNQSAVR